MSLDSRTGAAIPIFLKSVSESSTWSAFLTGPRIETFFISPLGPTIVILSILANCPGCESSFFLVRVAPAPKSFSRVSCVTCTWRADVSTITFIVIFSNHK